MKVFLSFLKRESVVDFFSWSSATFDKHGRPSEDSTSTSTLYLFVSIGLIMGVVLSKRYGNHDDWSQED